MRVVTVLGMVLVIVFFEMPASHGAERLAGKLKNDAKAYRDADAKSEVIGQLRKGTTFWITSAPRSGFYWVALPKSAGGARAGWVQASDLSVYKPNAESSSSQEGGGNRSMNFMGGVTSASPGDWQNGMGVNAASVSILNVSLDYRNRLGPRYFIGGELSFSKFSIAGTGGAADGSGAYAANDIALMMPVGYYFIPDGKFNLVLIGAIGAGSYTAENTMGTTKVSTSNIMAFRVNARVEGIYWFNRSFSVLGGIGYTMSTLSEVPIVNAAGSSKASDGSNLTANANLGGLSLGLGVGFGF